MNVLVMGPRGKLLKALEKLGIEYSVWPDKNNKPITHIIAGTEASVIPAAELRRELGARSNPLSEVEKCADKLAMKNFLSKHSIPMTDFIDSKAKIEPKEILQKLGSPVIVKPRRGFGGRGLVRVQTDSEIVPFQKDGYVFEREVIGTEGSVDCLISDSEIKFQNITRYVVNGEVNLVPADYSNELKNEILDLNKKTIKALGIKWGMTHLEFYITKERVIFGEIAIRPPGGYIMNLIRKSYGFNPWMAFAQIELGLDFEVKLEPRGYSGAVIFPRSEGTVESVSGVKEVESLKTLTKLRVRVKPGDQLDKREGVSDSCGYALFFGETAEEVLSDLEAARKALVVEYQKA